MPARDKACTHARRAKRKVEEYHHIAVANWLENNEVCFAHYPAGGSRHKIEAANLKRQGTKKGISDLLIFDPPPRAPFLRGMVLEMKRPDRSSTRIRKEQKEWFGRFLRRGWIIAVGYGSKDAIEKLTFWGYDKRGESSRLAEETGREMLGMVMKTEMWKEWEDLQCSVCRKITEEVVHERGDVGSETP